MFENWVYTTFYVMAEMWSTMIMSVLFWGFANETTPVKDAKRFYGLFGIGANFSGVVAGLISVALSKHIFNPSLPFGESAWDQSLTLLNMIVVISGMGCMAIFWWLNSRSLGYSAEAIAAHKESPIKMGIRKNFSYLAKSKYLILIALIVVTYNISINLIEVVWKDQVKQLYPNPGEFNAYMGDMIFWIGVIATGVSLFVSGNVIRFFGWTASALVPPVVTLVTGVLFFVCLLVSNESLLGIAALAGMTPAMLALFFGSLQNCLARGSKYTLFDATKELAFVPLSPECKLKGKAAIDGVGSRIGKSGGSLIHQCLLMFFGSISLSTPFVGCILLFVVGGWILAVRGLGKQFNQLTTEHQTITVPEEEQPVLSTT
jgi:AAA family ATP:ADP antiporter